MSDFTTITQDLIREFHLDTSSTGTQATNDVKRAAIDAMRYMETECPWFLVSEYTIPLVDEVYEYNLPDDYASIDQAVFFVPDITQPKIKWPIRLMPLEFVKSRLSTGFEWESTVDQGDPSVVAVDPSSKKLIVAPTPDSSSSALSVRIYRNGNIPYYKYASSTWSFYDAATSNTLGTTFTNPWLSNVNSYKAVFYKAAQLLADGPYSGGDKMEMKSQKYERNYMMEINKLRAKETRLGMATYIPRHL